MITPKRTHILQPGMAAASPLVPPKTTPHEEKSYFIFTDNNQIIPGQTNIRQVNWKNHTQLEGFCSNLKTFLSNGFRRIVFFCHTITLDWELQATIIYRFLSVISSNDIELLIITNSDNSLADQLLAAVLSLKKEQGKQSCRVLQNPTCSVERALGLFDHCFQQAQPYHYDQRSLHTLQWQLVTEAQHEPKLSGRVLLVGGSGGIGKALAKHLTQKHQCQVFMISRRTLALEQKESLKSTGTTAFYTADICDHEKMSKIYQYINEKYGAIDHIYQLAGTYSDCLFSSKSKNSFIETIKPKMAGTQVVEKLARKHTPKSVVLFSSLSSVLGNAGQTDYAAANAFLDYTAKHHKNEKTKWQVINWGLWQTDDGMQIDAEAGISAMPLQQALESHDQIVSLPGNVYAAYQGPLSAFIDDAPQKNILQKPHTTHDQHDLNQLAVSWIKEIIIRRTKFRKLDEMDNLLDLGVDSIIATHIATNIQQAMNKIDSSIIIPKALLFEYSSVQGIAQFLIKQYTQALLQLLLPPKSVAAPQPMPEITQQNSARKSLPTDRRKDTPLSHLDHNAIAIVAMAGEFPGADDIGKLWAALNHSQSLIEPIPKSRWDWQQFFGNQGDLSGNSYCRHGGFIRQAKHFDHDHFNITARDAYKLDPQVRRALHQTTFALEQVNHLDDANLNVGVFASAMYSHYQNLSLQKELVDSSFSAVANHISHHFDFTGPSLCVDTMCSGGLTALHMATNSLRLNQCHAAVVAGVNIMPNPNKYRFLSEHNFLSPNGKCHSFGIAADGYVPGEGVIALVLKPLKSAIEHKDHVFGIIRGSAINAIGKNNQLTVPSAKAQSQVIKQALKESRLTANDISFIEAHGTGTKLGDPIEIDGLNRVFKRVEHPIGIGSIKSNIGHLEPAAGLAGIVKVLLQMHHKTLVPTLNCRILNPHLDLKNSPLKIQRHAQAINTEKPIFAGVSAFGAGGSNAHVIIESPPQALQPTTLPTPKHVFNSKPFWQDFMQHEHAPQPSGKHPTPAMGHVFYTPTLQATNAPLIATNKQTRIIYICQDSQVDTLKNMQFECTVNICPINQIDQIKQMIEKNTSATYQMINVCSYEKCHDMMQCSQLHFEHLKLLANMAHPVKYIYAHPSTANDQKDLVGKALSMSYHSLALENNHINLNIVSTDLALEALCRQFNQYAFKPMTQPMHYTYQQGNWLWKTLQECNPTTYTHSDSLITSKGVYIITGGLGAIGTLMCKYLLEHHQAHVVCLGRSTLTNAKLKVFNELSTISPTIEYHAVDIKDQAALKQTIQHVYNKHRKINGVIHSACVLHDKLLKEKSWPEFRDVLACKIIGANNLLQAIEPLDVDFCAFFSSISSVFGNIGQTDYTMANAYLDELAQHLHDHQQQHKNTRFISINWPIWSVESLTIDESTVEYICDALGIEPLDASTGTKLFDQLISLDPHYSNITPLYGYVEKIRAQQQALQAPIKKTVSSPTNVNNLLSIVKKSLADVIKIDLSSLHEQTSINELGMSSVLLTEFATTLEQHLNIKIAPSVFFRYTTIEQVVSYLQEKAIAHTPPPANSATKKSKAPDINIDERYAIIGMSHMLPHDNESRSFWEMLLNNRSAIRPVDRWSNHTFYASTLKNIGGFDNKFFNLSNREALLMDPQHRLFLQTAYNAILNSGYKPTDINNTGVFVGVQFNDYQMLVNQAQQHAHPYSATGNAHAMLANRVSYMFDFNGPSQTIDTACSSAFVAINRGLLALKNHEVDTVLVGACSLLIDPSVSEAAHSMGVLSPQNRCATFDADADGYVRGEGVGAFIIKRLGDALRDHDAIHAIIESCVENHGGRAHSLTAPNPIAQKALLLKAYTPDLAKKVGYIETHGTGTKLGDPIEIDALTQAFQVLLPDAEANSIMLGAVKTNVGHLEPAAGIPSLVKAILCYQHHCIPANINFKALNPYIALENTPFKLLNENTAFNSGDNQVIGISSFGFGGSNAHLVLSPPTQSTDAVAANQQAYPIVLSAKSEASLLKMKLQLAAFLSQNQHIGIESIAYTLCHCRDHFDCRFGTMTANVGDLIEILNAKQSTLIDNTSLRQYLNNQPNTWDHFFSQPKKCHLPGYAFDHQNFWLEPKKVNQGIKAHAE